MCLVDFRDAQKQHISNTLATHEQHIRNTSPNDLRRERATQRKRKESVQKISHNKSTNAQVHKGNRLGPTKFSCLPSEPRPSYMHAASTQKHTNHAKAYSHTQPPTVIHGVLKTHPTEGVRTALQYRTAWRRVQPFSTGARCNRSIRAMGSDANSRLASL